jgi:hypothetical protein
MGSGFNTHKAFQPSSIFFYTILELGFALWIQQDKSSRPRAEIILNLTGPQQFIIQVNTFLRPYIIGTIASNLDGICTLRGNFPHGVCYRGTS